MANKQDLLKRRIAIIAEQLKEAVDVSLLLYSEESLSRKEIVELWEFGVKEVVAHVRERSKEMGHNLLSWLTISRLFNHR